MKRSLMLSAASAALVLMAADTGSGTGGSGAAGAAGADPIKKADPTPQPQTATEKPPAEPSPDPQPNAVGNAKKADPSPPNKASEANKVGKRVHMVWVQPGHESLGIGQMIAVPTKDGEALRGAGRARYASDAEVKAAGESKAPGTVLTLDGV